MYRKVEDIAYDLHRLRRFSETSLVERHSAWLAKLALEKKDEGTLGELCLELLKSASSGTDQVGSLRAICVLTVEDPYVRAALKGCEGALRDINDLKKKSTKEMQIWASRAFNSITNDDVHSMWSELITEPINLDSMKGLKDEKGSGKRKDHLVKLAESLSNERDQQSHLAELYLGFATKLAERGPLEQDIQAIGRLIRQARSNANLSKDISVSDSGKRLCEKLVKYMRRSATAIAAMEEIITLTMELPGTCKIFQEIKKAGHFYEKRKTSGNSEVSEWALRVDLSIDGEGVHKLWSGAMSKKAISWSDMQLLWAGGSTDSSKLANYAQSLSDPNSSYIAKRHLETAMKKSVVDVVVQIQAKLHHDSIPIQRRHAGIENGDVDKAFLENRFGKLLQQTESLFHTAGLLAMDSIIALTIEDPYVRKTLQDCYRDSEKNSSLEKIKKLSSDASSELHTWASRCVTAIEDTNIHNLWSKAIAGREPLTEHETQHLLDRSVSGNNGRLAKLLNSLNSRDASKSYLAVRYLHRIKTLFEEQSSGQNTGCEECKIGPRPTLPSKITPSHARKLLSVLKSTPEGSLRNLSSAFNDAATGKGIASVCIQGVKTLVKCDVLDEEHEYFATKTFAMGLCAWAKLVHPNISKFLGYADKAEEAEEICFFISESLGEESLSEYLAKFSQSPGERKYICLTMSLGIAKGVCYLHKNNIVHGDLKAANVLISRSGDPVLANFEPARMTYTLESTAFYSAATARDSVRWVAYEYYHTKNDEVFRPTFGMDIWAFGMTILEILTLEVPYAHIKSDGRVARAVSEGELPTKDSPTFESLDAELKNDFGFICDKCWSKDPLERPPMQSILCELIKVKYRRGVAIV